MEVLKRLRVSFAMLLAAVFAACAVLAVAASPAFAVEPAHTKTLTPNGDGSYALSLSVTGSSTEAASGKADVVILMDLSNSMQLRVQDDLGPLGYPLQEEIAGATNNIPYLLYKKVDSGYVRLNYDDEYDGEVYTKTDSDYTLYTGKRYTTRLAIAKRSAESLVEDLLSNNTSQTPDKVQVALVTFADDAVINQGLTTDASALDSAIEGLTYLQGHTNWEAAFQAAGQIQMRDDAAHDVVLVSDGAPNTRYTEGSGGSADDMASHPSKMGSGKMVYGNTTTESPLAYQYGLAEAQKLVDAGDSVYTVATNFSSDGETSDMSKLVGDLGESSDYALQGTDEASIKQAFAQIAANVSGYAIADVKITDGLTPMTGTELAAGSPDGFTYTTTDANGTTTPWTDAPAASFDGTSVTWDLTDAALDRGTTYTVSFKVWPKQEAYDLLADLANGTKTYDALTDEQKAQIVKTSDGGYALKTNSSATVDYADVTSDIIDTLPDGVTIPEGQSSVTQGNATYTKNSDGTYTVATKAESSSAAYESPLPMSLEISSPVTVQKVWHESISKSAIPASIDLDVMCDGAKVGTITLSAENNWTASYYMAPGLVASGKTLDAGHDYTLAEESTDYKFEVQTIHPMIVEGMLKASLDDTTGKLLLTATNSSKTPAVIENAGGIAPTSSDTALPPTGDSGLLPLVVLVVGLAAAGAVFAGVQAFRKRER